MTGEPAGSRSAGRHRSGSGTGSGTARLTVLSGPSGVGKSAIVAEIRAHHPGAWLSVSVTTRTPRPGEVDGVHYHFANQAGFDRMVAEGALLEHALFAGNWYGTPREPVMRRLTAGLPALLEIDLEGARQVRSAMPGALLVFLAPPSWDELVRRLVGRGTEDEATIAARLAAARVELAAVTEFDLVIVNDDVKRATDELVTLLG